MSVYPASSEVNTLVAALIRTVEWVGIVGRMTRLFFS